MANYAQDPATGRYFEVDDSGRAIREVSASEAQGGPSTNKRRPTGKKQPDLTGTLAEAVLGKEVYDYLFGGAAEAPAVPQVLEVNRVAGTPIPEVAPGLAEYALPAIAAAVTANRGYEAFNRGNKKSNPLSAFTDEFKNPFSTKNIQKSPLLFPLNPMLASGGALMNNLGFGGKSDSDYKRQRTGELSGMGFTKDELNLLRPETTKAQNDEWFRLQKEGKAPTTEQMSKDPLSLWGSDGMLKAYGRDYFDKMSEKDRYAATKYAIDKGYFQNDHGDWVLSGDEKADLKNNVATIVADPNNSAGYDEWLKGGRQSDWYARQNGVTNTNPLANSPITNTSTPGKILPSAAIPPSDASRIAPEGVDIATKSNPQLASLIQGGQFQPLAQSPQVAPGQVQAPQPVLQTPEDFTNAFLGIYERNTGQQVFNPLARRF